MAKMKLLVLFHIYTHLYLLISAYTPPDNIALNCGDHGNSIASDGRKWTGDISSKFISSHNASSVTRATTQDFAPLIPYMTARIFHSQFTYTFPVTTGPKFVRFHFHPASYPSLNISDAFFSIFIQNYTVLSNFSTLLTASYLNTTYFIKEFYVNMVSERNLNVIFIPSPGSFAFINGMEVVSVPTDLYINGQDIPLIGQSQPLAIDNNTALELVYRLNVDGQAISPEADTGMFRSWIQDIDYIYGAATGTDPYHFTIDIQYTKVPSYTAPDILYRTARSMGTNRTVNENYNLTWVFPVDSGFYYLTRLHFCEIAPEITGINQRVFEIFLNNQTADDQMDIMVYAGGIGVPIYRDFILMVPETGGKVDLWLALHPNTNARAKYSDAILNGLEIIKLNKSDGSLAGPNPDIPEPKSDIDITAPASRILGHRHKRRWPLVVAGVIGGAVVLCIVWFFVIRQRKNKNTSSSRSWWEPDSRFLPSDQCRNFSLPEIKSATNNFSPALLIGVGGFGNVYKGHIDGGETAVAIKRLNPTSNQGAHEFKTEIQTLTQLRHLHLVSLIGYCEDSREMILVYDYLARGTLREHLYHTDNPPLPWKLRLQICIGAAKGLYYLHSGAKERIIHRDVKTTNILLDENWVAKVSDFGLSKVGPTSVSRTHVSTAVKGSIGYLDPEYYRRQQLTEKSDVYSFGVVLFEVLCARPVVDKDLDKGEICLSEWARTYYTRRERKIEMNHAMISGVSASSILVQGSSRFNLCEKPNFLTNNRFYSNTHLPKSSLFTKTRPGSVRLRARPIKAAINDMYATVLPSTESFYNLLGVSESGCTFSDIKKAYKQLARKYHPDVSPPDRTEEYTRRFIEVREAYETLSDPTSRSLYDRDLAKGLHLAFSARKRSPYDQRQGFNERVKWRNWWEPQLTELMRRSVNKKDSRDNASWGARMRRQMEQTVN